MMMMVNYQWGDKVQCFLPEKSDSFYVLETPQDTTVNLFAEWNINVKEEGNNDSFLYPGIPIGYQNSLLSEYGPNYRTYGYVKFDSNYYGYWTTGANHDFNSEEYTACSNYPNCYADSFSPIVYSGYPANVYDDHASIKTFVKAYETLINDNISGANARGRLIRHDELLSLGCTDYIYTGLHSCSNAPNWIYNSTYWTGIARDKSDLYIITFNKYITYSAPGDNHGVRPVIEMSSSVILIPQN